MTQPWRPPFIATPSPWSPASAPAGAWSSVGTAAAAWTPSATAASPSVASDMDFRQPANAVFAIVETFDL